MFNFVNNRYGNAVSYSENIDQNYYQRNRPLLKINTFNNYNNIHRVYPQTENNYEQVKVPKGNVELQISYQNYFGDDYINNVKKSYGNELRDQIRENERKRELEKQRLKEQELQDELRLKKEQELLNQKAKLEEMKREAELLQRKKENERIISSYSVMSHPKSTRNIKKKVSFTNITTNKRESSEFEKLLHQRKLEIENFNKEINDILNNIRENHTKKVGLIETEIQNIKNENFFGNLYKVDLKKGLHKLKKQLKLKQLQENYKKDYIYNLYVNTRRRRDEMDKYYHINKFKLPTINLDHHIHSPGIRIDNGWYCDNDNMQVIDDEEYKRDQRNLQNVLVSNSQKVKRLNRLDDI